MPYDFEPHDLEAPRVERDHVEAGDDLDAAYRAWLEERGEIARREIGGSVSGELYELARSKLSGVRVRAAEATSLPVAYREETPSTAGLFLTAAYNRSADDVAVFDVSLPTPLDHLGFRLDAGTALVLDGSVHATMAVDAEGVVVNRTDVERYFGYSPTGVFINAESGSCLTFGVGSARLALDFGTVRGSSTATDTVVAVKRPDGTSRRLSAAAVEADPDLAAYLDEVREGVSGDRRDVEAYLSSLSPTPKRALVRDVESFLGWRE